MSLSIVSSFNGVTDPDAGAYIAAVEAADGQLLEFGVGKAINDFVVGCKQDRIWGAIKASCILSGARTLAGALVPLAGTAPTNVGPFVSGDYNRKTGLVGNGTTKYLDSNRNNNADPQNSKHISVFTNTAQVSGSGCYIGGGTFGGGDSVLLSDRSANILAHRVNNGLGSSTGLSDATGFIGASRASSASFTLRVSASTSSVTATSETPRNVSILAFARRIADANSPVDFSSARLAFYSIGESLDLALLDARVTSLINAFAVAIP